MSITLQRKHKFNLRGIKSDTYIDDIEAQNYLKNYLNILNQDFHDIDAFEIIQTLITQNLIGSVALVSSFGADSNILLHMVSKIAKDLPILFINTGKLFQQTLSYKQYWANAYGLTNIHELNPQPEMLEKQDGSGDLHQKNAAKCCMIRKTMPLSEGLKGFDGWITGRRRYQTAQRINLPLFESDEMGRIKCNPLAYWSKQNSLDYIATHKLPPHPLRELGYRSIGCAPCTRPVQEFESDHDGRWSGLDREECGIHLVNGRWTNVKNIEG